MTVDIDYARRGDISIAYQVVGDGPVDVIFGAGLVSHLDLMWGDPHATAFLRNLGRMGRLLLFDKPGTGLSDPVVGIPTAEQRAEDFVAVMDAAGSKRAVVIGYSEAAAPAALLAATRPERVEALIVLSAAIMRGSVNEHFLPEIEDYWENVLWRNVWRAAEHWGDGEFVRFLSPWVRNSAVYSRLGPTMERACASPGMARAIIEGGRAYDVLAALPGIRVPTLVLQRQDEVAPVEQARYVAEHIEGSQLEVLPGDEHVHFFGGEDLVERIAAFVGGGTPSRTDGANRVLSTILFTDIEASTERAAELGDERWRDLLGRHDLVTTEEVELHGGRLVKRLGDGALACFERPAMAIRCATKIQARMASLDVAVRAGVHTGECELVADDVAGIAVHLASRIAALAQGAETLVSSTVRDLVLGSGIGFADRGRHELKGVPGTWEISVVISDSDDEQRAIPKDVDQSGAVPREDLRVVDRAVLGFARRPKLSHAALRLTGGIRRRAREKM